MRPHHERSHEGNVLHTLRLRADNCTKLRRATVPPNETLPHPLRRKWPHALLLGTVSSRRRPNCVATRSVKIARHRFRNRNSVPHRAEYSAAVSRRDGYASPADQKGDGLLRQSDGSRFTRTRILAVLTARWNICHRVPPSDQQACPRRKSSVHGHASFVDNPKCRHRISRPHHSPSRRLVRIGTSS